MDGLFLLILIVAALVVFDLTALGLGIESRPGSTEPRTPAHDISG